MNKLKRQKQKCLYDNFSIHISSKTLDTSDKCECPNKHKRYLPGHSDAGGQDIFSLIEQETLKFEI